MALPTIEGFMIFALRALADGKTHYKPEIIGYCAKEAKLNQDDMALRNKANALLYKTYIHWALVYMTKAGLIERLTVENYKITSDGLRLLSTNPSEITHKILLEYPMYQQYRLQKNKTNTQNPDPIDHEEHSKIEDPITIMTEALDEIDQTLKTELLEILKKVRPSFFEKLVLDLLLAMGYGGFRPDAGIVTGKSGDEGLDGEISQDKLGLEKIYIQAKRFKDSTIGRPIIQQFAGSILGKKANKGVFITTSDFSTEAKDYAKLAGQNIILINGQELVELMIEFNIGVSEQSRMIIKKVDHDYFSDEDI